MKLEISTKSVFKLLIYILAVLAVLSLAGQLYKYIFFSGQERYLVNKFDLDMEVSFPTWYSTILLFLSSVLLGIIYLFKKNEKDKFKIHWFGLSFLFFLMATDEILSLHEQVISPLRQMLHTGGIFYFAWIIPAMLFGLVFLISYYKFLVSLSTNSRKNFITAGIIYVMGAVGFEAIGGLVFLDSGKNTLTYAFTTNTEEIIEMIGMVLFIYYLLTYIKENYQGIKLVLKDD